jgi:poly-beta-1,6-N-acetyl-D-glucosamine biosynthesis protein PgaD
MNTSLQARPAPLIRAKRVPFWLLFRDLLLTAVAWIAIAQSMRQGLYLLYDYFSAPVFTLTRARAPDLLEIWNRLNGFVWASVCLVIWLAAWAFYGHTRLSAARVAPQPAPLPITEHAKYLGVKPDELARWKTYRIAVVVFDADNQVVSVSRHDHASAIGAAK